MLLLRKYMRLQKCSPVWAAKAGMHQTGRKHTSNTVDSELALSGSKGPSRGLSSGLR